MEINLNNYEEFFLLYADQELTIDQRQEVEKFVQLHPFLKKELDEILATIQQPDDKLFDKSFLYKTAPNDFITGENYQEKFVEYFDDELSSEGRHMVKSFVALNERYKNEFHLIGKARLEPDENEKYPAIEELYKRRKVVALPGLLKYAAAAVLVGFIIWFGRDNIVNKGSDELSNPISAVVTEEIPVENPSMVTSGAEPTGTGGAGEVEQIKVSPDKPSGSEPSSIEKVVEIPPVMEPGLLAESKDIEEPVQDVATAPGLLKGLQDVSAQNIQGVEDQAIVLSEISLDQLKPVETDTFIPDFGPELAKADEFVFFDIPLESLRNTKVGVFIKKVKRTIDRTNPLNRLFNEE